MPLNFTCSSCGKEHRQISSQFIGKRIKCTCGKVLRLGPKSASSTEIHIANDEPTYDLGQPESLTRIENVDPVFGKKRQEQGYQPEHSVINPISPLEKKTYLQTHIPANYHPSGYIPPPIETLSFGPSMSTGEFNYPSRSNTGGYWNLIGGIFGSLQGVVVILVLVINLLMLFQHWSDFNNNYPNAPYNIVEALRNRMLVASAIMVVMLMMTLGLTIVSVLLMLGGIREINDNMERRPDLAIHAGMVGAGHNIMLFIVGSILVFGSSMSNSTGNDEIDQRQLFQTAVQAVVTMGALSIVPFFLIGLGVVRSYENKAR